MWVDPSPICWCLYEKKRLEHSDVQRENQVKMQEDGHLQPKERGLGRNNHADTSILDF